jgi:hypothetical protein
MLISHKYKFITIDIPKTGTRSFRESLVPLGVIDEFGAPNLNAEFYQHDGAIRAKKQFAKNNWNWNEYFKFTIVRNPWVRYFSFFKYLKRKSELYSNSKLMGDYLSSKSHVWQHSGLYQNWINQEINDFRQAFDLLSSSGNDQTALKKIILNNNSQESYYRDESGKIIVDHIAEFENLQNEFVLLCDKVGIQAPSLEHENKSVNSLNMHDFYDQELIDLVAQKEESVIQLKGYDYIT